MILYAKGTRVPPAPRSVSLLAAVLSGMLRPNAAAAALEDPPSGCAALTNAGGQCRAAVHAGGAFCPTHWRVGAGVACWSGPLDSAELRPADNVALSRLVAAVRLRSGELRFIGVTSYVRTALTVGIYLLEEAGRYRWLEGGAGSR